MNEEINIQNKKYNLKLYPFYKAFSWDLLFYYAISFLFFTQIKGISASQVLLIDGFYTIFKLIFQFPATIMVNKFGNRISLIIGNIFVCANILTAILAINMQWLLISQLFCAFGFSLKGLTESSILFDSIEKNNNRNDKFSKIEGKGSAFYYFVDAITSLSAGFLFVINGYLPMVLCFICCIISLLISFKFKDIEENNKKITFKENVKDLRYGFKFIFQSNRLKSLIIFSALFSSILILRSNLSSSLFTDINLPEQYFGIIYAVSQVIASISATKQNWFHNKYKNRTLTRLGLSFTFSMIFIGLTEVINLNYGITLEIILIMLAIQCVIKGPYYTLIKRYLNSFSTSSMRTKIYSALEIIYDIVRIIITFTCSFLLNYISTSYVYIVLGCIFTVIMIFLLDHMKHTVGLKPEEYNKKDIEFLEVK